MGFEETLRRRLPKPLFSLARAAYNQRPEARRQRKGWAQRQRIAEVVVEELGDTVLSGPFKGLRLGAATGDSPAKLLGCYESELHGVIEELICTHFDTIVNVGSADGYYAVGMAMRCPETLVIAYDIDKHQQELCRLNARLNGVGDRLKVRGECRQADLIALGTSALVIMDCEGCEDGLLSPDVVASILVELHDWDDPTAPDRIIERLRPTHEVAIIWSTKRNPADYPSLSMLSAEDREIALFERPKAMRWAVLRPTGRA